MSCDICCAEFTDVVQILPAVVVEAVCVVLEQRKAKSVDTAQRRAEIVRHRIAERLQLFVLGFELGDQRGTLFGHFPGGAGFDRLHLRPQQLFANAPRLVFELLAPDLGMNAGAYQVEIARLGDVIVGTRAETLDHRLAVFDRGEHHDRNVARIRRAFHPPARLATADPRHEQVEQNAIDLLNAEQFKGFLAGTRQHHLAAIRAQRAGQLLEVGFAVIDRENLLWSQQARGAALGAGVLRPAAGAAEHRVEAREYQRGILVLAHEGVGASFKRMNLGAAFFGSRKQQAREAAQRRVEADAPDHGRAVYSRQLAIDHDSRRPPVGGQPQAVFAGVGDDHPVGRLLQRRPEGLAERHAVVDHENGILGGRRGIGIAPHQLARARHQIIRVVGLADIFVGAGVEAADPVANFRLGRKQHHRRIRGRRDRTDFLQQLDAVAVRQQDIEDHQRKTLFGEFAPRFLEGRAGDGR